MKFRLFASFWFVYKLRNYLKPLKTLKRMFIKILRDFLKHKPSHHEDVRDQIFKSGGSDEHRFGAV